MEISAVYCFLVMLISSLIHPSVEVSYLVDLSKEHLLSFCNYTMES